MTEMPCPGCGRPVGDNELLCPHCGAAQVPQYTRTQLSKVIGSAREGAPRLPMGVGCLLGLLAGLVLAVFVVDLEAGIADPQRWRLQGEVVFLLMILGIVLGLVYAQWQALRRRKRKG
jgi:hypothetical protein